MTEEQEARLSGWRREMDYRLGATYYRDLKHYPVTFKIHGNVITLGTWGSLVFDDLGKAIALADAFADVLGGWAE